MSQNRNSFNKRRLEIQKKQKAEEKRTKKAQVKDAKKNGTYVPPADEPVEDDEYTGPLAPPIVVPDPEEKES